jgi:hypothetical protein
MSIISSIYMLLTAHNPIKFKFFSFNKKYNITIKISKQDTNMFFDKSNCMFFLDNNIQIKNITSNLTTFFKIYYKVFYRVDYKDLLSEKSYKLDENLQIVISNNNHINIIKNNDTFYITLIPEAITIDDKVRIIWKPHFVTVIPQRG